MSDPIELYFPGLSAEQKSQFARLTPFYTEWNEKINLISRKDMSQFMLHHVLHSLALGKWMNFTSGTEMLDVGTGGGFPGIPLAILWPKIHFHLIDGTGKKIKVVQNAIEDLGLSNATAEQIRIEDLDQHYDFVIARAVTELSTLIQWARKRIKSKPINARPNGLIAYKGYPLGEDQRAIQHMPHELFQLSKVFKEEYFVGKCLVYVPLY
ncbi:MAG: 16S rRNA (guanine(527)-N(7))-methyltransferase RsmG [Saprospiraceae bacterium]|nr:16S rRNA (guanine(527)-N(7))-methyltransferase RsmG [Saprospiraceae bacterium]